MAALQRAGDEASDEAAKQAFRFEFECVSGMNSHDFCGQARSGKLSRPKGRLLRPQSAFVRFPADWVHYPPQKARKSANLKHGPPSAGNRAATNWVSRGREK